MNDSADNLTPANLRNIEDRMHPLEDRELLRIVAIKHADYRPEAVEVAKSELCIRGIKPLTREQYYEKFPLEQLLPNGFCLGCYLQTTDESPGNTYTTNLIFGTRLMGFTDQCKICGSILQRKWLWCIVPILPIGGKYRVIYKGAESGKGGLWETKYIGRKLKSTTTR